MNFESLITQLPVVAAVVKAFIAAAIANQSAYLLTPKEDN